MYCPQCGNRQPSGEIQFCPSCGFALGGVRWLLASGGEFPKLPLAAEPKSKSSPRRRGINQGIVLLMFASIIVPVIGINGNVKDGGTAAIFFFGIALARIIYALLIQSGDPSPRLADAPAYAPIVARAAESETPRVSALPASTAARVNPVAPRRTTAELVTPPSVTDHTTRLLEKE